MKSENYMKVEINKEDIAMIPEGGYNSVLIFLHGLGDSALGMKKYFESDKYPLPKKMKILLLTATPNPVSIYGGRTVNSWFDIKNFTLDGKFVNEDDVYNSTERIAKVIDKEAELINNDYQNIFLGGVSQGCAMALHVGLTYKHLLGGLIGISGFMFPFTTLEDSKKKLPIFLGHGNSDFVIPEFFAQLSYSLLYNNKFNTKYKSYNVGHNINEEELADIKEFIESK